jgi:NADPH-dependent 2,4-dienoyl-CoA reductase/sulfur reductase-like enzyme
VSSPGGPGRAPGVVVVGASAAGSATAVALRRGGYADPITLVGDESVDPYDRPPLSKGVLKGEVDLQALKLSTVADLEGQDIEVRVGRRATGLDLHAREVHLDEDGGRLPYSSLVIATGASARKHDLLTPYSNVHVLRTAADAVALRAALRPGVRLGVVGGGLIGLEVAATARALGVSVTVVEPALLSLADRLSGSVANWLLDLHVANGVDLRLGMQVGDVVSDGDAVTALVLDSGDVVDVDVVLVAIGAGASTAWLEGSGLRIDDGVVSDEFQQAGDGVYAVGDVARSYHPVLRRHLRLENRTNATEGPLHLARTLLGERRPYAPVPFFWTDQYVRKVQVFGVVPRGVEPEFVDGNLAAEKWVGVFRTDGRLCAVAASNAVPKAVMPWRRELNQQYQECLRAVRSGN